MATPFQNITRRYNWLRLRIAGSSGFFNSYSSFEELAKLIRQRMKYAKIEANAENAERLQLMGKIMKSIRNDLYSLEALITAHEKEYHTAMEPIRAEKRKLARKKGVKKDVE